MSHDRTTNDLLLQVLEGQQDLLKEFGEHKGATNARLETLESTAKWHKWTTYVVNPIISIGISIAAHFGIQVPRHP